MPCAIRLDGCENTIPILDKLVHALKAYCDVCVVALNRQRYPSIRFAKNLIVIQPGRCGLPLIGWMIDAARAYRMLHRNRINYDVIHSFWLGRAGSVARYLRAKQIRPWIVSIAGQELNSSKLKRLGPIRRWQTLARYRAVLDSADVITAGSRYVQAATERHGYKSEWWPLFPDPREFSRVPSRHAARRNLFRLITIADHNEAKDSGTLLKTIQELARRGLEIHLDWVGLELIPGKAAEEAAALGIEDRITIHGHMPHAQIPEFLHQADAYLQSSKYESQGVSVCEAALCGLPIVGTSVGILADLAPENALVVPSGDSMALADAVERLIDDCELCLQLGNAAYLWMSRYSLDWTVQHAIGFYESARQRKSPG